MIRPIRLTDDQVDLLSQGAWPLQVPTILIEQVERIVAEQVEAARAEWEAAQHPDLPRLRAKVARAVEHGYTEGDVNHNVQPIIGWMRVQIDRGEPMGIEAMTTAVERLYAACDAETAWLNTPPRAEGDSKQ